MSRYLLLDAFQDIILVVDREWKLHFGNTQACLLMEVTPRRLASGKPLSQFMEFESPITDDAGLTQIAELSHAREVQFKLPGAGKSGWAQVVIQPVPEHMSEGHDDKERWMISMRDTTLERTLHLKYRGELDQKESVIRMLQDARKALEEYSSQLEKRVEERTVELSQANRLQKTILDSLGQGILVFNKDGICLPVFSKVCLKMLNGEPSGRPITDVLGFIGNGAEGFTQWREAVFDQLLDFEDMVPLAPNRIVNAQGLEIHFDYYPMQNAENVLTGIVVVATDRTREMAAIRHAEEERQLVGKVTQVARNRDAFRLFVSEAKRLLTGLQQPAGLDLEDITRRLHTLKGGAASFSLIQVADACHSLENEVKDMQGDRPRLDQILIKQSQSIMGYMSTAVSELAELLGPSVAEVENQPIELSTAQLKAWSTELSTTKQWDAVRRVAVSILREATEKPVGPSILHHSASLKGLAATMGKQLETFEVDGADTKVSSDELSGLLSSLVHAFRNSVYHGLETPDERKRAGKADGGKVFAHFSKSVAKDLTWLKIEIGDDGRGVDPSRIRKKLTEIGLLDVAAGTDEDVVQAILRDDFSTSTEVNLVAGRGVGLSAIAAEAKALGGSVRVISVLGKGMTLEVLVPLEAQVSAESSPEASKTLKSA